LFDIRYFPYPATRNSILDAGYSILDAGYYGARSIAHSVQDDNSEISENPNA